ncbi:hypothetical protein [Methylomonas rapida]|uniref:Uncharacterized protein n=1 Tax=Methylomonas rapida TaxID=2963939 RepID=A0ABY7GLR4_9GAMM|nr:hypothetical protein [Methylomonas rapida]WAR45454.1 hypothetical protein NM686_002780 [Methylomonas rapida]
MDISSIKNNVTSQLAPLKSRTAGTENLAEAKPMPGRDGNADTDNSVARDSATLSRESLQLASTSTVQGTSNQTQIPDRQKAQEVLGQIVTMITGQPKQALDAFSNASPAKTVKVLA